MRVALVAVGTGQFVWYQAAGSFVWMLVGGTIGRAPGSLGDDQATSLPAYR